MASLNEATIRDALLIFWDVCTDLNEQIGDDEITQKLSQARRCIAAIDIPKSAANKARDLVDADIRAGRAAEREAAKT